MNLNKKGQGHYRKLALVALSYWLNQGKTLQGYQYSGTRTGKPQSLKFSLCVSTEKCIFPQKRIGLEQGHKR